MTAAAAGTWVLGDRTVNRLGSGAMRVTGPGPRERAVAVLRRAVELGVNHVDTAAFYFSATRSANQLIGAAQGPHVLAIPGTGDPAHLEQNVAAAGLRLDL